MGDALYVMKKVTRKLIVHKDVLVGEDTEAVEGHAHQGQDPHLCAKVVDVQGADLFQGIGVENSK